MICRTQKTVEVVPKCGSKCQCGWSGSFKKLNFQNFLASNNQYWYVKFKKIVEVVPKCGSKCWCGWSGSFKKLNFQNFLAPNKKCWNVEFKK